MRQILSGNYEGALRQLSGARTAGGHPAELENLRGLALLLEGKTATAMASFDRALALDPSLQPAQFNRGLALLRGNELARAAAIFEKLYADEHSPLRADAAYHLGITLDRLGRAAEAESWLDRAIRLDPKLDAALLYVGVLRERRGDLQGAGRAYQEYLSAHPRSPAALLRFGLSAQKAGRAEVARSYLQRVIDAAPRSMEAIQARKHLVLWE